MILAALVVASLLAAAGAAANPEGNVINGLEAEHGAFPYMALVLYEAPGSGEGTLCSGTVVSSNVVLTAAHCVLNETRSAIKSPANFRVVTGNVNWASPERTISTVTRISVAPNLAYLVPSYDIVRGDAAVLQLSQPISAPAVKLATSQVWGPGTTAVIAGWGLTQASQSSPPPALHVGETVVQGTEYCHSEEPHYEASQLVCVLDYPSEEWGPCHGDSGGPLLMVAPGTGNEPLEIGITSFGQGECSTGNASYFTNVAAIAPWVNTKIAEFAPPTPVVKPPPVVVTPAPVVTPTPKPVPAVIPKLPALTKAAARVFTTKALTAGMPSRFGGRRGYSTSCSEVDETKQKCFARWSRGGTDYWGYVTIYYAFEAGKVVWSYGYSMKAVNDHCYFDSGRRELCTITTLRR